MITVAKAIKKLSKYGTVVLSDASHSFEIKYKGYVVAFNGNGGNAPENEVYGAMYRRENDHSDAMSDYCAWSFTDSINAAIKSVDRCSAWKTIEQVQAEERAIKLAELEAAQAPAAL